MRKQTLLLSLIVLEVSIPILNPLFDPDQLS